MADGDGIYGSSWWPENLNCNDLTTHCQGFIKSLPNFINKILQQWL